MPVSVKYTPGFANLQQFCLMSSRHRWIERVGFLVVHETPKLFPTRPRNKSSPVAITNFPHEWFTRCVVIRKEHFYGSETLCKGTLGTTVNTRKTEFTQFTCCPSGDVITTVAKGIMSCPTNSLPLGWKTCKRVSRSGGRLVGANTVLSR